MTDSTPHSDHTNSVHEDKAACAAHALVLAAQILPPRARAQVVEPGGAEILVVVLRKACATPLQLDDISAGHSNWIRHVPSHAGLCVL